MKVTWPWIPALLMGVGVLITRGVTEQTQVPLRASLAATVPVTIADYVGRDFELPAAERDAAGVTAYLLRRYAALGAVNTEAAQIYVGYYDRQLRGKTIHSPKNCLPGAGWEALALRTRAIDVGGRTIVVNQYVIQREERRALVLYWYQGRGRVASNEYRVKFDLLRDAALLRRSDEALVRVVVPITNGEASAVMIATRFAQVLVPSLELALPS